MALNIKASITYPEMTAVEQLQWVTDLEELMAGGGDRVVAMARSRQPQWTDDDAPVVCRLVDLLAAWPFARDFAEKARLYGDYMSRTARLPVYMDKVKAQLAEGITMTDPGGHTVVYVTPSAPLRRRGRPSAAEVAARQRGETPEVPDTSPDNVKRRKIAALLGLPVIVHGKPPREKNNAEIAAEKAARQREYERQNPSLFDAQTAPQGEITCPSMSEVYQSRIAADRHRLADLAWLCSDALKKRIATADGPVQSVCAAIDEELAILFGRLSIDTIYREKFLQRFRGVDIRKVLHITRPYYETKKKADPAIDERIHRLIRRDSPDYAASLKAGEKKRREIRALHRYLMRKDKDASDDRVRTMTARIARLRKLAGDAVADTYLPVLEQTRAANLAWRAAKEARRLAKKLNQQ